MGTFLTTPKMAPELAARIASSVRGRRARSTPLSPRVVSVLRLGFLLLALGVVSSLIVTRYQDGHALERERSALLDTVHAQAASLTEDDKGSLTRAQTWLARFSGAFEGDLVDRELQSPGALAAFLSLPAVYVRGPLEAARSGTTLAEPMLASVKDSLLLCLVERPPSRTEKAMIGKVRIAYSGLIEQRTTNVHRLHDADAGLRVLLLPWAERVRAARDLSGVVLLRREFEQAPIEKAKQAARARLLILALDEPADGGGPADLDGERAHEVRVGLVDVASGRILLRTRKRVDPSAWSPAARAEYASGLDGCGLAVDVYESASL